MLNVQEHVEQVYKLQSNPTVQCCLIWMLMNDTKNLPQGALFMPAAFPSPCKELVLCG